MVFQVHYDSLTRSLTRQQLEQAPQSLLSRVLLLDNHVMEGELTIESGDKAGAWQMGTPDLFKVVIASYTGTPEAVQMPEMQELNAALIDYFALPERLWPLGLQIARTMSQMVDAEQAAAHHIIRETSQGIKEVCAANKYKRGEGKLQCSVMYDISQLSDGRIVACPFNRRYLEYEYYSNTGLDCMTPTLKRALTDAAHAQALHITFDQPDMSARLVRVAVTSPYLPI